MLRVQAFTIKASCERLNLPDAFIAYVLATLDGATSTVRCRDGHTAPIDLMSGVRQGCPLSALLFIIVMDPLHACMPAVADGYTMTKGPTVHSLGFSDDTATVNSSWEGTRHQHQWVRGFFAAHHLRLNASKTVCVVGSGLDVSGPGPTPPPAGSRTLPGLWTGSVHDPYHGLPAAPQLLLRGAAPLSMPAETTIRTCLPDTAFRYLGYMVRVDLDPAPMVQVLNGRIFAACRQIQLYRLDLDAAGVFLREYLYPRLELGLAYTRILASSIPSGEN